MNLKHLNILLADDDRDDRFLFSKALSELPVLYSLTTVNNGEQLLDYLLKSSTSLPDILFLDLNMPRKSGFECLEQIHSNTKLKHLPVIIYSTSFHDDILDLLYAKGAHYCIRKSDFSELKKTLFQTLTLFVEKKTTRPSREEFLLDSIEV